MGRFSGDKVPVRFSVGSGLPSGYGGTDFEAENIYSVLGRWPETDLEWSQVEFALGHGVGQKVGMQRRSYRPGEVLGPSGMMATPDMGKRFR